MSEAMKRRRSGVALILALATLPTVTMSRLEASESVAQDLLANRGLIARGASSATSGDQSATPSVASPLTAGTTTVAGVSTEPDGTTITVSVNGAPTATTTVWGSDRLRAFPSAYGYGAFAQGGRGGRVIEVTNLNADGPGSLRAAVVEAGGPRTVVFRVSGIIDLARQEFIVDHPYLTIAGQTAPGDGITVKGGYVSLRTHDVIIRHVRFRPGPGGWPADESGKTGDGFGFTGTGAGPFGNTILDHVSISWGTDENLGITGPFSDITVQNSVISEPMHCVPPPLWWGPEHPCTSLNLLIAYMVTGTPDRLSFHHNMLADGLERNPGIHVGTVDWVNNVVSNWGVPMAVTPDMGGIQMNVIGNYYQAGSAKNLPSYRNTVYSNAEFLLATDCFRDHSPCTYNDSSAVYIPELVRLDDPLRNLATDPNVSGPFVARTACRPAGQCLAIPAAPLPFPPVPTTPAHVAYPDVLAKSGATLPHRDPVDSRVVRQVIDGRGRIIDTPDDVGGYPAFPEVQSTVADSDRDGMPDGWEQAHGLDPGAPNDGNGDFTGDGYTNLEKYLNEVAGDGPAGGTWSATVPSLAAGDSLTVTATAPGKGESAASDPVLVIPAAPPTNLSAVAASAAKVNLSWTPVSGASSYRVLRATAAGGPYTQIAAPTGTTYANSNLTPNTTYYYVVRTASAAGTSANSTEVPATTMALPLPPANVSAIAASASRVNVSWTAVSGASGYRVLRATAPGGPYTQIAAPTGTTYANANLSPATTYYYVVRTVSVAGTSSNSQEVAATTAPT